MSKSVEFKNKDAVMTAYDNAEVAAWGIFAERMLKFKGMTREELEAFLDLVEDNGDTAAIYTLCLFEGAKSKDQIKSTTPYDYSFNFKLNVMKEEARTEYREQYKTRMNVLEEKFDLVLEKFNNEDESEKPDHKLGMIGDIINHPSIAPIVPLLIQNFIGKILGVNIPAVTNQPMLQPAASLAGVNDDAKIMQAIARLKHHDPNLGDHLLKLAEIAETNTPVFNMLIQSLDQS